ncbi:MAG TPA: glycosyltransferase, partial [Planctomycetota bacterium]|nr:glycosyltransferase [Planctomycetota bacterium]
MDLRIPLLLRLRAAGFEVAAAGAGCAGPFQAAGIRYFEYGLAPGLSPLADLAARRRLARLFREHRPDIAHAFDTKPGLLAPHAARGCPGLRCVTTITGLGRLFARDDLTAR